MSAPKRLEQTLETCLLVEIGGPRQVTDSRIDAAPEILKNHGEMPRRDEAGRKLMFASSLVV
jgi:hypothetical protein